MTWAKALQAVGVAAFCWFWLAWMLFGKRRLFYNEHGKEEALAAVQISAAIVGVVLAFWFVLNLLPH